MPRVNSSNVFPFCIDFNPTLLLVFVMLHNSRILVESKTAKIRTKKWLKRDIATSLSQLTLNLSLHPPPPVDLFTEESIFVLAFRRRRKFWVNTLPASLGHSRFKIVACDVRHATPPAGRLCQCVTSSRTQQAIRIR